MPRPATGEIIEYRTRRGEVTRTLRFQVNGRAERKPLDAVSREDAERELSYVLADVARGTYEPARTPPPSPKAGGVPGFHDFADEWWELKRTEISEGTQGDYQRRLEVHLIPHFGETPLDQIRVDSIDGYKAEKLRSGLSPRTVNMQLVILTRRSLTAPSSAGQSRSTRPAVSAVGSRNANRSAPT
jgi:hypothetical protein